MPRKSALTSAAALLGRKGGSVRSEAQERALTAGRRVYRCPCVCQHVASQHRTIRQGGRRGPCRSCPCQAYVRA